MSCRSASSVERGQDDGARWLLVEIYGVAIAISKAAGAVRQLHRAARGRLNAMQRLSWLALKCAESTARRTHGSFAMAKGLNSGRMVSAEGGR